MTSIQPPDSGHLSGNPSFAPSRLGGFALNHRHQVMIKAQSRQKALQSCLIKAHQGSSRQTANFPWHPAFRPGTPPSVSIRVHLRSKFPFGLLATFVPRHTIKAPSRQKPQQSCLIKTHQALSRQTQKISPSYPATHHRHLPRRCSVFSAPLR